MKYDIQVCPRCGRAMIRLVGDVDGDDLCEVLDALIEGEGWDPKQSDLWDLRALDDLFIAPDRVAKLARRMPPEEGVRGDGRTALITQTLTQLAYGTLFFNAINPPNRARRSFRSGRRAARWLGTQSVQSGSEAGRQCGRDCPLVRAVGANLKSGEWA